MLDSIKNAIGNMPANTAFMLFIYFGFMPVIYWVCRDARAPRWAALSIAITWPICVLVSIFYATWLNRH